MGDFKDSWESLGILWDSLGCEGDLKYYGRDSWEILRILWDSLEI